MSRFPFSFQVQAHKVVLAVCSPLFRRILAHNQNQLNPLLYLKGISIDDLNAVLNFMYHGEVNIPQVRAKSLTYS